MLASPSRTDHPADRLVARAAAAVLAMLALYGCWSAPGLVARWGASGAGIALLAGWAAVAGWSLSTAVRRPRRIEVAGFAVAALALRIGALALSAGRWSPGDAQVYRDLAAHLLDGRGLAVADPYLRITVRALYPPAYPVALAGWAAVAGLSPPSVLAFSTLVDLIAATLIARLGAALGMARPGVAAAALYLVWPSTLFSAPLAQKEGLEGLLIVALALGWLGARRPGRWRPLAIGLPAGLLALTQPGQAALAALFGLALLPWIGWRWLLAVGVPAAGVAAAVLAVVVAQLAGVRRLRPAHQRGRPVLVGGRECGRDRGVDALSRRARRLARARRRAGGGTAGDRVNGGASGPVAALNLAKLVRAGGVGQFGLVRLAAMRPSLAPALAAALLPLSQGAHVAMLGAGAAALAARPARAPARYGVVLAALIAACLVQVALIGLWFEFGERHREFLTPFQLLAIAAAIRPRTAPAAPFSAPPAA